MKQETSSIVSHSFLTEDEIGVSQILLELPRLIYESESRSRFPFTWGTKRKRSALDETPSTAQVRLPSSSTPPIAVTSDAAALPCLPEKPKASNPATPLSFPPSESDEKPKQYKKVSVKRRKEELLEVKNKLTQSNQSLKGEIEKVKRHYDKLKQSNLELIAKKQELSVDLQRRNSSFERIESSKLGAQFNQFNFNTLSVQTHHDHSQQSLILDETVTKSEKSDKSRNPHGQTPSWLSSSSGSGTSADNSLEESSVMDSVHAFDLNLDSRIFSGAMAAQAKQKIIQIC